MDIPTLNFDHSHHKLQNSRPAKSGGCADLRRPRTTEYPVPLRHSSLPVPIKPSRRVGADAGRRIQPDGTARAGNAGAGTLRTLYGVITGFKHLSSSRDEARYEVRLEPVWRCLPAAARNAIYQNQTVPQIVEKILRERRQMRGRTSCLTSKANTRPANR